MLYVVLLWDNKHEYALKISTNIQSCIAIQAETNRKTLTPQFPAFPRRFSITKSIFAVRFSFLHALHCEFSLGRRKTKREVKVDASKVNKSKIERLQTEMLCTHPTHTPHTRPFAPTRSWVAIKAAWKSRRSWVGGGCCQLELNLIKSFMSACLLKIDK